MTQVGLGEGHDPRSSAVTRVAPGARQARGRLSAWRLGARHPDPHEDFAWSAGQDFKL